MKGLRGRILLVGLLSAIVGIFVSRFYARSVATDLTVRFGAGALETLLSRGEAARCLAEPRAWKFEVPGSFETFAYDGASEGSANTAAPPLDPALVAAARRSRDGVAVRIGDAFHGGAMVLVVAPTGACAVLQTTWRRLGSLQDGLALYAIVAGAVGGLTTLLSFWLAIRPLAARVARLRVAAAAVGHSEGYTPESLTTEDDFGHLARELDRAHGRIRRDAEQLLAEHTRLERHLADVAHDLRTPIASLQLALEHVLTSNRDAALGEPLRRALDDTVYLVGLTENLRLASQLTGSWDASEVALVDLRVLIERVGLRLRFFAQQKEVELEVAVPDDALIVSCQAVAVEQAVANVVENAVSLGIPGGHVAVVLAALPEQRFVLTVVDDGPGVRGSELPRLGERTFRSDEARQRAPRGTGLGLAITAEVCKRSGWVLAFAQEEPRGLRVSIRGARQPAARAGT